MLHECERKKGLIWDVLVDRSNNAYCASCGKRLEENQIHPSTLKIIKKRFKHELH